MDYARKQKSRDIKKSLKIHLFKQLTLGFAGFAERTNFKNVKLRRRGDPRHLVRRPSYRKILTELGGHHNMINEDREQSENDSGTSEDTQGPEDRLNGSLSERLDGQDRQAFQNHLHQQLRVVPTGALLGSGGSMSIGTLHDSHMNTQGSMQYSPSSENGGFYGNSGLGSLGNPDETTRYTSRKREIRLLKNREAARECRRKKKEYIKCLENRVAVLENQNKALIEELKSLKELYTGGKLT
ncbi:cyclic AMP-responsive element-binding protein isoform X2 [Eurytemora carolleeae]|uniref:cyclic AMP-responsive element-binding protein isoform X2 n=1 Tax=Eurytemora carolleeae TaxID=1294199 RepID=UPI000C762C35|nr:cyclic AMP-responsive element-binding protein isoform X2 [Eurytemora carolleeae]|eukprot:XP_023347967.1 cyclic AMP-responsive element-binding protein-like isoform X2 [Eurytemora affinis]